MHTIRLRGAAACASLIALLLLLPLAGCDQATASAPTKAQREARLLRGEVEGLRAQVAQLETTNAKLEEEVETLRETSHVKTGADGLSFRLSFGAAAVVIAALAAFASIRITRMRLAAGLQQGAGTTARPGDGETA